MENRMPAAGEPANDETWERVAVLLRESLEQPGARRYATEADVIAVKDRDGFIDTYQRTEKLVHDCQFIIDQMAALITRDEPTFTNQLLASRDVRFMLSTTLNFVAFHLRARRLGMIGTFRRDAE